MGFDPGLTVGIAILDLDGNLLSIESCREISKAKIINHIIDYGKALLIASDVYPPPKMIKKLASALNSKIHSPPKTMSVESKIEIVENYLSERSIHLHPENTHERDALAAAVKTYKHYQNKLRQVEKRAENLHLSKEEMDNIKSMVIRGRSISSAIDDIKKAEVTSEIEEMRAEGKIKEEIKEENEEKAISKLRQKTKVQEKQIRNLRENNIILKAKIEKYKDEISKLRDKIDKLYYEYSKDILYKKEISSKIAIIKGLQEKYTQEKALRRKLEENLRSIKKIRVMELSKKAIPVKIIESFTKEGIRKACEYWNIKKGDVVLLSSSKGGGSQTASFLIQIGVRAVIIMDKMSHQAKDEFERNMVPILDADKIDLRMVDEFAIVKDEHLDEEIKRWRANVEDRRRREEKKKLLKVIDEYRAKRKRNVDDF